MIAAQKARYNELGTPYYRPWIFCITDGGPNDSYAMATQRLKEMEDATKVLGYCVGVANFDRHTMASIFNTERIFELDNLNFPALFKFVSCSLATVRNSDPNGGRTVAVEAPSDLHTIVDENYPDKWHEESLMSLLRTAYHKALKAIRDLSEENQDAICDYDTTLTTVIYNGTNAVYGHAGDGGIIALSSYGDYSVLTQAQKGEAFNETCPLRAGPENWSFGIT